MESEFATRVVGVFSVEEIESLNKKGTRIEISQNPEMMTVHATTGTLLATIKADIEEMSKKVLRKVIPVNDKLEKDKVDIFLEKHDIKNVKVVSSTPNTSSPYCVYRLYAHPTKQKPLNKLYEDIWFKELRKDQAVPSTVSASSSVTHGKVGDLAAGIEKVKMAKTVGSKQSTKPLVTKSNDVITRSEDGKSAKTNTNKKSPTDSPADKNNTHTWNVDAPKDNHTAKKEPTTSSVPPQGNPGVFDKSIQIPGMTVQVKLLQESITRIRVDAVVNAANEHLSNGAGVAKVLSNAGGLQFDTACKDVIAKRKEIQVTKACVTTSGNMKNCKAVIHAVGPMWDNYREKDKCLDDLCETVKNVLREACANKFKSVAMPPISSGITITTFKTFLHIKI